MNNLYTTVGNPRRWVYYAAIFGVVFLLSIGFFRVQILESTIYQKKSEQNSVKIETQFPVRGLIYDRNGRLIADNRPSFSLYLVPAQTQEKTLEELSRVLGMAKRDIRNKLHSMRTFNPVKIARHVDLRTLTYLQENILDLPGLEWKVEPKRHYVYSRTFSHVLGTLGEADDSDLKENPEYEQGDIVGKKGLEKVLDKYLRGSKGVKFIKVDAFGRNVGEVKSNKNTLPYPGKDVYLTLDSRLQLYADTLFGDRRGALVAVDVHSGEVLTLLSKPQYDLTAFSESVDPMVWNQLLADTTKPLYNRAAQAAYPPGSTYKLVAAIAALNEGIITPKWTANCPGYYRIGRKIVRCWKADGHGELDLLGAIKNSCNVYFYQLGLRIGIDIWSEYSRLFLFGKKTNVELTSENRGLVPSKAYYNKIYGEGKWTRGILANIAIGQGELLVTPLQMAQFAMILANQGIYYPLHLRKKFVDRVTGEVDSLSYPPQQIGKVKPEVFAIIREGMREVVDGGTGWRAEVWRISGAGKTGTAQNPHGDSHAWFIGFAPFEDPEIAIAVIVENGGSGGGVAAPIVGKFLRRYFYFKGEYDYQAERRWRYEIWKKQQEKARQDSLAALGITVESDTTQ